MSFSDNSLGRSLNQVFARTTKREPPSSGYLEVDLGLLRPPSANPRTDFDEQALRELAESVRMHGMLQPIVVLRRDPGFEILSGERRWRAAQLVGLAKVPVVVRDEQNPQHVAELRLIENIQRQDLGALEIARAFKALIEVHGLTHDQLADRVNKDRSTITNSLRLLALPPSVQERLAVGALSAGHAKALLTVADPQWQAALAEQAVAEGLSVREVERLAKEGPPATAAETASPSTGKAPHLRELETNLFHLFGTRVAVAERRGGKGTLTLHFDSRDQFQRIVAIMDRFVKQSQAMPQSPPNPPGQRPPS